MVLKAPPWPGRAWMEALALALLVTLAAGLRFYQIDRGLRHEVHPDESVFADHARAMLARGDLDHGYHQYPALFIWILAAVGGFLGLDSVGLILAGRCIAAVSSVAAVLLLWAAGRSRLSPLAAAFSCLLLALSPVDIHTSHGLRPDALLAPLAFLAIAAMSVRPGFSGVAVGAATAVKFTGGLLVLPLGYTLLATRTTASRSARILAAGALTFVLFSPYTLLAKGESTDGMLVQLGYHFNGAALADYPLHS